MADLKSDHARARAMDLLTMARPFAGDEQSRQLRELAVRYLEVAERPDTQEHSDTVESLETVSEALDAVASDYFSHALRRAVPRKGNKARRGGE